MKALKTHKMKWKLPEIPYQEQLLFIVVFGIVIYGAYSTTDSTSLNVKRGLIAIVIMLIGESMLKPYDILFLRPNMAFWRAVLKCVQLYYYALIFLAYQKIEDGRSFFKFLDPSLGVPVPESMHTYDTNCGYFKLSKLYYSFQSLNGKIFLIISTIIILFIGLILQCWSQFTEIKYFVGFGAFLLKLLVTLHIYYILFLEISLQHILPHFAECWWDHIILDVLISNMPGIIIGYYILKWLKMEDFDLVGNKGKNKISEWGVWKCHRRFGLFLSLNATYLVAFAGGFFVWNGLWVPPNNLWVIRILVWLMTAILSNQEIYYDNLTWNTPQRRETPISGKMRWNACSLIIVEIVIIIKYWKDAGNMNDNPTPIYIWLPWLLIFLIAIAFYIYLRFKKNRTTMYGPVTNLLFILFTLKEQIKKLQ